MLQFHIHDYRSLTSLALHIPKSSLEIKNLCYVCELLICHLGIYVVQAGLGPHSCNSKLKYGCQVRRTRRFKVQYSQSTDINHTAPNITYA